jgi:Na+(H+)/acetate symporter ActP
VPLALSIGVVSLDLSRTVGLVFAVAASTLCPLLVLGIWWRGLTAAGAAAGLFLGGGLSLVAASISVVTPISDGVLGGWAAAILGYPAAVSVPVAFAAMIVVSLATRRTVPSDISRIFARLHLPEGLDMGKDREREL